jgi:hypothetical protein
MPRGHAGQQSGRFPAPGYRLPGGTPLNPQDLTFFKEWFADYCVSFTTAVEEDERNIAVKKHHTYHVCLNALRIGRSIALSGEDLLLAETIALFHDLGRFPQYRRYKTFDDDRSTNHAALGATVLLDHNVLRRLPEEERKLIVHAVTLHNVFAVPAELDERTRLFVKIIRDADKLDIWRVFVEYYGQDEERRASAVALGLPDRLDYSPKILACLREGRLAPKTELRTLNDFKLLQLTWLYDLNFTASLQLVLERGYIDAVTATLPRQDEIRGAVDAARAYVGRKLGGG